MKDTGVRPVFPSGESFSIDARGRKDDRVKCCKTCKYSSWELTLKGNIKFNHSGSCLYEVVLPPVPVCVRNLNVVKNGIWPEDGDECPVWEKNNGPLNGDKW